MYGTCMLEKINTETFRTILHEIRTKKPSISGASLFCVRGVSLSVVLVHMCTSVFPHAQNPRGVR